MEASPQPPERPFFPLTAEDTDDDDESVDRTRRKEKGDEKREKMELDVEAEKGYEMAEGGIIFSPGGSEAYVFPRAKEGERGEQEEEEEAPTGGREGDLPREIDDPLLFKHVRGERPATVGQSDNKSLSTGAVLSSSGASRALPTPSGLVVSRPKKDRKQQQQGQKATKRKQHKQQQSSLQERMQDLKMSLDQETSQGTSVESSPRVAAGAQQESRRMLPRLPVSRDQFLQDPDGFNISLSELEMSSDHPVSEGSLPSPVVPSLPLTDRATSPSSVVSAASSTASGMLSGRKHLEWDSGADLGYAGDLQPQEDAAMSMSTLEKMAIGSYSGLLRTDPEGKSAKSRSSTRTSSSAATGKESSRGRTEDEMRQIRLHKFADSLMRQRELRRMAAATGGKGPGPSPRRRQRSRSRDEGKRASKSDSSPEKSGAGRRHRSRRKRFGSPLKSASLTDLNTEGRSSAAAALKIRPSHSNQDVSVHWFSARGFFGGSTDPSSCSSTGTVVPILAGTADDEGSSLHPIDTDPASLPSHLQGLFPGLPGDDGRHLAASDQAGKSRASQTSLGSKKSGSRSFETVINLGQHKSEDLTAPSRRSSKRTSARDDNSDSQEDTEDDDNEAVYFDRKTKGDRPPRPPKDAWVKEGESGGERSAGPRRHHSQVSRNSSAVTTSDDERNDNGKVASAARTASSTMESAHIDRAKSFEYFPGESFPMQENSSSYEYLPGHMVSDRPGTVVSNYHNEDGEKVSGVASISDSSSYKAGRRRRHKQQGGGGGGGGGGAARRRIDLDQLNPNLLGEDMRYIDEELNERSRELLKAHFKRTRHFYKRVRRYITYVSQPSISPEESQKKQEVLGHLLQMLERSGGGAEEATATSDDSVSSSRRLSDLTTKQVQTDTTDGRRQGSGCMEDRTDVSTTTNGEDEEQDEETKVVSSRKELFYAEKKNETKQKEIEMQKRRIEQLRAVRREMKKLENLESAHLIRKLRDTKVSGEPSDTEVSSVMSSLDKEKEAAVSKKGGREQNKAAMKMTGSVEDKKKKKTDRPDREAGFKKAAGEQQRKGLQRPRTSEAYVKKTMVSGTVTKTKTHLLVTGEPPRAASKSGRPSAREEGASSSSGSSSSRQRRGPPDSAEFGQTYPTPRDGEVKKSTRGVQTNGEVSGSSRRNPVAYYLPLGGQSVIKIGTRILREQNSEEGSTSKENRSIIANYIAGMEGGVVQEDRSKKRSSNETKKKEEEAKKKSSRPSSAHRYTLGDALALKRPGFVAEAERRRRHLIRMRQQRLENESARRRWLEELARMTPRERRRVSSPPPQVRVTRLFGHREMVEETRRRYHRLPEVAWKRQENRKRNSAAGNRLVKDMYGRRLQENVLRGKVSLTHHSSVIDR